MLNKESKEVSIVLFEDDDVDAMGIERELQRRKLTNPLFRVRDGIEGLELMRSDTLSGPFLVLLDLNMPRMNGLEALKEIRNDPKLTKSVVFVLTTSQADEDVACAYSKHIAGYIVKKGSKNGFEDIFNFFDYYCQLVELPGKKNPHRLS